MNRKTILLAMDTMLCGGIEKSAISLLRALPAERYRVTLLLMRRTGELLGSVPDWVDVREVPLNASHRLEWERGRKAALRRAVRTGRIGAALSIAARYAIQQSGKTPVERRLRYFAGLLPKQGMDSCVYDCAIAYANWEQLYLVAERIAARRKIAWLHTELSSAEFDVRPHRSCFEKCQHVFTASRGIGDAFKSQLPALSDRVEAVYYHVDEAQVRKLAGTGSRGSTTVLAGFVSFPWAEWRRRKVSTLRWRWPGAWSPTGMCSGGTSSAMARIANGWRRPRQRAGCANSFNCSGFATTRIRVLPPATCMSSRHATRATA